MKKVGYGKTSKNCKKLGVSDLNTHLPDGVQNLKILKTLKTNFEFVFNFFENFQILNPIW